LRLLLRRFAAGTWEGLPTCNGQFYHSFYEAAQQRWLVSNENQEAAICVQEPVDLQRPPGCIPFLLAQMVKDGARRELLVGRFFEQLADEGDTLEDVHRKIDLLLHSDVYAYYDPHDDDQLPPISDPDSSLSLLTPE
jgi:hypothetical protein